jgi:predicted lactoylglutathione lyase
MLLKTSEVLTCLSFESKEKVNEVVDNAIKAGGSEVREPMDYGFMYARSFNDPDGHIVGSNVHGYERRSTSTIRRRGFLVCEM